MRDHHRHAKLLQLAYSFFGVFLLVVFFLKRGISADTPPEDGHTVVIGDHHDPCFVQPGRARLGRRLLGQRD